MFSRTYSVLDSNITIIIGDILTTQAQVLVTSIGGKLDAQMHKIGGSNIFHEFNKQVEGREVTAEVFVTTAGALPSNYIFHVYVPSLFDYVKEEFDEAQDSVAHATDGDLSPDQLEVVTKLYDKMSDIMDPSDISSQDFNDYQQALSDRIEFIIFRTLEIVKSLRMGSIAYPALGTGLAGHGLRFMVSIMLQKLYQYLSANEVALDIELYLYYLVGAGVKQYLEFFDTILLDAMATKTPITEQEPITEGLTERITALIYLLEEDVVVEVQDMSSVTGVECATLKDILQQLIADNPLLGRLEEGAFTKLAKSQSVTIYLDYLKARGLMDEAGKN